MKPASRLTDMTLHGGTITGQAAQTLIGGQPAARKGDPHVCPVHGPGVITGGSASVLIEGKEAARMLDPCGCALTGVSGAGAPPALGPGAAPFIYPGGPFTAPPKVRSYDSKNRTSKQVLKEDRAHGRYAETEVSDSDGDGTRDTARAEAGVGRAEGRFETPELLGVKLRGKGGVDAIRGRAEARASSGDLETGTDGFGGGAGAVAEADGLKANGEVELCTPIVNVKYGGVWSLLNAGAEGDVLFGDDGSRIGIGVKGKAGAGVAGGKGSLSPLVPDLEFKTPWGISIAADNDVGGGLGVGAEGEYAAYLDRRDGRVHFRAGVGGKLIFGASANTDISVGPFFTPADGGAPGSGSGGEGGGGPAGGIPNKIATGFPLVFIGD